MNCNQWQRARSSQQVETREREILSAAEKLFRSRGYEKITMQMIARESGFSQSNLYRYFRTKEEIFLNLYLKDIHSWLDDCLLVFRQEKTLEEFASVWTETLSRQERLLALSPYLAISLEKNSSEEVYKRTKQEIAQRMTEGVAALRKTLPHLDESMLFDFFIFHGALLSGLLPMTKYSSMQRQALKEINLQKMEIEFPSFYEKSILTYLKGLK